MSQESVQRIVDRVVAARIVTALKDPNIVSLNRALKTIRAESVKYLNDKINNLIWNAGSVYDYIGRGSQFRVFGRTSPEASPDSATLEVTIVYINRDAPDDAPVLYEGSVSVYGKNQRQLDGSRVEKVSLEDLKKNAGKILFGDVIKTVKDHLEGSLERELDQIRDYASEAETAAMHADEHLSALRKLLDKTKSLDTDAGAIARHASEASGFFRDAESEMRYVADLIQKIQATR
jgi:hypothetical protein